MMLPSCQPLFANRETATTCALLLCLLASTTTNAQVDPFAPGGPGVAPEPRRNIFEEPAAEVETDPGVLAILESKPTTPAEVFDAAMIFRDMERFDLAESFLKKLIEPKPNPAVMAGLQRSKGSAIFVELSRDKNLGDTGSKLADAVMRAGHQASRSPGVIKKLLERLTDDDPAVRYGAEDDLKRAGPTGVSALLNILADPDRAASHAPVQEALISMRREAVMPLMAAMTYADPDFKVRLIEVLGQLRDKRSVLFLLAPYHSADSSPEVRAAAQLAIDRLVGARPSRAEAVYFLHRRVNSYMDGAPPSIPDFNGQVPIWYWDPIRKISIQRRIYAKEASMTLASRVAQELYAIAPENEEYKRLFLGTSLAAAKILVGEDRPLPINPGSIAVVAANEGPAAMEEILTWATREDLPSVAAAAAEVLGAIGDEEVLYSRDGQPRPLTRALAHGSSSVRFAAMDAILLLDPRRDYPGSSLLPRTMSYFIGATGTRRALVVAPQTREVTSIVGMLNQLGFETLGANNGQDGYRLAIQSPDNEVIFLSAEASKPSAFETIQLLRKDARTAAVPIAVFMLTDSPGATIYEQLSDPNLTVVSPPQNKAILAGQLQRVLGTVPKVAPLDTRTRQASAAIAGATLLAENRARYHFYDMTVVEPSLQQAAWSPLLGGRAAHVLGLLGTGPAQEVLVNIASQNPLPIGHRRAASAAFKMAVEKQGIMLTAKQILLQYTRYNNSERLDPDTQQVLGSILDVIEPPQPAAPNNP